MINSVQNAGGIITQSHKKQIYFSASNIESVPPPS